MNIDKKETRMLLLLGLGLLLLKTYEVGDIDRDGTANTNTDKGLVLLAGAALAFFVL